MLLEIYLDPCTVNSRKVLARLDVLEVPYRFNYIDCFTGQHKSNKYEKINPCAIVPAAVDSDLHITSLMQSSNTRPITIVRTATPPTLRI
jgi:glutathione S-transferase